MDSFSYARSVQQQAQSSYGNTLEQYNQERQIATAHFEAEKKEIVDPLAFIGGGMATSAAGSLGKKIAAKSGIKAFEKLGQESISTTMKNAAKEALEKGKSALTGKINGTIQNAISKDGGKDLINKTLRENGYSELSDADFANPSTLGDKILKQSVSKAKAKLPDIPDPEDVKPPDTVDIDDLEVDDDDLGLPPDTPSEAAFKKFASFGSNAVRTPDLEGINAGVPPYMVDRLLDETSTDDVFASDGYNKEKNDRIRAQYQNENAPDPTHINQLGDDALPAKQEIQEMDQSDNSLGRDLSDQDTTVNGQPKPPDTEQDAIRPASPKPDADPVPDPVDEDVAKAGEGAEEGLEEGTSILSKITKVVGTADAATGGLDIGGDILEAGLGLASLFLPGLLDTQKKAAPVPVNNFIGTYEAGTGVV